MDLPKLVPRFPGALTRTASGLRTSAVFSARQNQRNDVTRCKCLSSLMSTTTFDAYIHVRQALEHVRPLLSPVTYKETESRDMAAMFVKAHPHMVEHMKLLRDAVEKEDAFIFRRTMRNWYMNMAPWDRPSECEAWLPDFLGDAKFFGEDEIIHTGYQFPGSPSKKRSAPIDSLPPLIKRMKPNTSPSSSSTLNQSPPSPATAPSGQNSSAAPQDPSSSTVQNSPTVQNSSTVQNPPPGLKRPPGIHVTNNSARPPHKLSNCRIPNFKKNPLPPRKRIQPKRREEAGSAQGARPKDDEDEMRLTFWGV